MWCQTQTSQSPYAVLSWFGFLKKQTLDHITPMTNLIIFLYGLVLICMQTIVDEFSRRLPAHQRHSKQEQGWHESSKSCRVLIKKNSKQLNDVIEWGVTSEAYHIKVENVNVNSYLRGMKIGLMPQWMAWTRCLLHQEKLLELRI